MRRFVWLGVLLLCAGLMLWGSFELTGKEKTDRFVLTAQEQAYLESLRAHPLTIAYSYDLVNAEFYGEAYGMLKPVLDVLQAEFGLTVNLVKSSWHDAFIQVESGEVDFYGPVAISEKRRRQYITVEPFYRSYSKIITRIDEPINSMRGLYNRSVGLLEGSVISSTMQAYLGPNGQTVYFPTMQDMINGLKTGVIDALATVDNAELEIFLNDDIQFEFSIDNFYVDQGLVSAREDMRMLAALLDRYLKSNPQVAEEIIKLRRQALLQHSRQILSDEIAYLQDNYAEVILYSDSSLYPLCYVEKNTIKGMMLEITEIFEELTGVKVRFYTEGDGQGAVNLAVNKLISGQIMAIVGGYYDIYTWNNPKIEYSALLWLETFRTYAYKNSGDELKGMTLGALKFTADYLGWNNTTGNVPILYNSYFELLQALQNGEIDTAFMGEMRFNYGYSVLKEYSLQEIADISAEVPMYMLYGAANPEFNASFNEAMKLFQVLSPRSIGQWKAQGDKYKADYIRMRYTQQIWITVVIIVFMIMLTALIYLLMRNIKAYEKTKRRLVDALDKVHYDELTGIYNRRYLEENLDRVFKSMLRSKGMLSIMMLDVDFFKNYNDTYGHSMGDACLKLVAAAMQNSIMRADDFVARYGGEEFIAVLPNTDESGARVIANRMLENVRSCSIPHEKSEAASYVTISVGVTTSQVEPGQSSADYVKRADEALYISKHSGRNRYTFIDFKEETK